MSIKRNKKHISLDERMSGHGWVFTSPVILGFILFYGYIIGRSLIFSFQDVSPGDNSLNTVWIGFENYYKAIFIEVGYIRSLTDSILNMLYNLPLIIIFSLFTATILNEKLKGRAFFRAIFFIPAVLVTGAIADSTIGNALVNSMQSVDGIDMGINMGDGMFSISDLQSILGQAVLNNKLFEFLIASINNIFGVVKLCGVQILLFIAGLQSLPPSMYEAAHIEGANAWDRYWKITFPMITPIIFVNIIYSIIDSFTRASNPIMRSVYEMGIGQSKIGYASAYAWMYFIVILLILTIVIIVWRFYNKGEISGD